MAFENSLGTLTLQQDLERRKRLAKEAAAKEAAANKHKPTGYIGNPMGYGRRR